MRPCKNGTSHVTCKNQQDINLIFNNGNFGSYLTSGVVDPGNYESPIQYNPMNFYSPVSLKTFLSVEISMQRNEILTDSGALMEDISSEMGYSKSEERQSLTLDPPDAVFELLIRLDRIKKVFTRKYDKIQNVLANVGGIFNVLMLIGSILLKKVVDFDFSVQVSKKIFDIPDSKKATRIKMSPSGKKMNFNENKSLSSEEKSVKKLNLLEKFKNWKKKMTILWQAKKQMDMKMDLSFLMSKILDIEKIKYLIFDPDQLFLFDLIPKPKIYNTLGGKPPSDDLLKNYNKRLLNSSLNIRDFLNIKKGDKIAKKMDTVINKQGKSLFDERFIQLLQDANVLGSRKLTSGQGKEPLNFLPKSKQPIKNY